MKYMNKIAFLSFVSCCTYWLVTGINSFSVNFDHGHQALTEKYGEEKVNSAYINLVSRTKSNVYFKDNKLTYFQNIIEPEINAVCVGNEALSDSIMPFGNSMAIDSNTGLIWRQCPIGQKPIDGQCDTKYAPTMYNFADATEVLTNYSFSGFNDWRIPTLNEISTVYFNRCGKFNISPSIYTPVNPDNDYLQDDGDILIDLTVVENSESSMPESTSIKGLQVVINEAAPRQGAVFLVRGGTAFKVKDHDD